MIKANEILGGQHYRRTNISFIDNEDIFVLWEPHEHDLGKVKCIFILFRHRRGWTFSHFQANIWVASFMVYAIYGSTFLQLGVSKRSGLQPKATLA